MRTSNTEHGRDLKLKRNSLCMLQKKFVLSKLTAFEIPNTKQHIFIIFSLSAIQSA